VGIRSILKRAADAALLYIQVAEIRTSLAGLEHQVRHAAENGMRLELTEGQVVALRDGFDVLASIDKRRS
jgi:hypothetical protein